MISKQSLLISFGNRPGIVDMEKYFNIVCLELPPLHATETQDVSSQEWFGEDGEDVYLPSTLSLKAFDWSAKLGCKASSASAVNNYINTFVKALKGGVGRGNAMMKIYSAFLDMGRQNIYFKNIKDIDLFVDGEGASDAMFTITFRVTDPVTEIVPNNYNNPTSLVIKA